MTKTRILVALPAYNEEGYVGTMVLLAKPYADEVMVVDDGSLDRTAIVAELAGATVIKHNTNRGYGFTIQGIMSEAQKRDFDVLVILDADTQHNPCDIPNLIKPILDGYDLVIGQRCKKTIPKYRLVGQKILSVLTSYLSGKKVSDTQSGFRAFSRFAVDQLTLNQKGMAISSEMVSKAVKIGLKVTEVPISVKYTKDGSTHNPVIQGVDTLARVINMISERKPLIVFGVGGLVLVLAGSLVGLIGYKMFLTSTILPIGTLLLSTLLITVGMLSAFTGIILHVVTSRISK